MALAEHYYGEGLGGIGASPDDVLSLLARARPAWMRDSLCSEYPAISWFEPADTAAAVAICRRCSVAEECAAWARQNGVSAGVWAGVNLGRRGPSARPTGRVVSDGAPARVREVPRESVEHADRFPAPVETSQRPSTGSPTSAGGETVNALDSFRRRPPAGAGLLCALPDGGEEGQAVVQGMRARSERVVLPAWIGRPDRLP